MSTIINNSLKTKYSSILSLTSHFQVYFRGPYRNCYLFTFRNQNSQQRMGGFKIDLALHSSLFSTAEFAIIEQTIDLFCKDQIPLLGLEFSAFAFSRHRKMRLTKSTWGCIWECSSRKISWGTMRICAKSWHLHAKYSKIISTTRIIPAYMPLMSPTVHIIFSRGWEYQPKSK